MRLCIHHLNANSKPDMKPVYMWTQGYFINIIPPSFTLHQCWLPLNQENFNSNTQGLLQIEHSILLSFLSQLTLFSGAPHWILWLYLFHVHWTTGIHPFPHSLLSFKHFERKLRGHSLEHEHDDFECLVHYLLALKRKRPLDYEMPQFQLSLHQFSWFHVQYAFHGVQCWGWNYVHVVIDLLINVCCMLSFGWAPFKIDLIKRFVVTLFWLV